jgi:hypothetical protein
MSDTQSIDIHVSDETALTCVPRHLLPKLDAVLTRVPGNAPPSPKEAQWTNAPSENHEAETQQPVVVSLEAAQDCSAAAHESAEVAVAHESKGSVSKRPVVPPIGMCVAPPSPVVHRGRAAETPNASSGDSSTEDYGWTDDEASAFGEEARPTEGITQTPVRRSWLAPSLTPAATTPGTPSDFGWFVSTSPTPTTPAQQHVDKPSAWLTAGEETPKGVLQRACQRALERARFK